MYFRYKNKVREDVDKKFCLLQEKLYSILMLDNQIYNIEGKKGLGAFYFQQSLIGFFRSEEDLAKGKPTYMKIGRYLNQLDRYGVADWRLESISKILKTGVEPELITFKGEQLGDMYHLFSQVPGLGACMSKNSYKATKKLVDFYIQNPDKVSVAVLQSGKTILARALLWKCDDGSYFLDRCYGSGDVIKIKLKLAVIKMALKEGKKLVLRKNNNLPNKSAEVDLTVTMENKPRYGYYPYMDTFFYASKLSNTITLKAIKSREDECKFSTCGGIAYNYGVGDMESIMYRSANVLLNEYGVTPESCVNDVVYMFDKSFYRTTNLETNRRKAIDTITTNGMPF